MFQIWESLDGGNTLILHDSVEGHPYTIHYLFNAKNDLFQTCIAFSRFVNLQMAATVQSLMVGRAVAEEEVLLLIVMIP